MNGYVVVGTVVVVLILIYVVIQIRKRNTGGNVSPSYSYQNNSGSSSLRDKAQGALGRLGDCCTKGIGKLFRGGA